MEIRIQDDVVLYDNTEFALHRSRAKGQDATFPNVRWTWIGRLECRQVVLRFEVQSVGHCVHLPTRVAFDEQDSVHAVRPSEF